MAELRERSEAREIERSLNLAIGILVFSSLFLAFSIWYTLHSIRASHWSQVVLGAIFLAGGTLRLFLSIFRIKEIVGNLLATVSAKL